MERRWLHKIGLGIACPYTQPAKPDTVARVFPAYRNYVRTIIVKGFDPASDHPFGLFPSGHLACKGTKPIEFTTPADRKGLGTMSWLLPSDQPTGGFALLTTRPEVRHGTSAVELAASALAFLPLLRPSSIKLKRMAHVSAS